MNDITILTPTYNRAHTLQKAYESLCNQTNKSFIWLIIDDGSTDETERLVQSFQKENKIEIQYQKKLNGGKASAINLGLDLVGTEFCTCLDSDDWFDTKTVEKALKLLKEERSNDKCCGILAIRNNPDGSIMGGITIPRKYAYINMDILYNKIKFQSELICFYKSKIVQNYRFPVFDGEKFMPPSWFHYKLCEQYVFRTSWDTLCYCEYIGDGLTKNKRRVIVNNPKGYTLIKSISFREAKGIKRKFKNGIMYVCGSMIAKDRLWLRKSPHKIIAIFCYPLAIAVYYIRFYKLIQK